MTDQYLWLEEVLDQKNLDWAKSENDRTAKALESYADFPNLFKDAQEVLESKEKIPFINFIDRDYAYNLWRDDKNPQGLFRRARLSEYNKEITAWEVLLDLDALSAKDNEKWVYHNFDISPNGERALISLSPGGSDADIVREYSLLTKNFVKDGFYLPLAKGHANWFSDNELLVSRDLGPETVTASGYSKEIRRWKRGDDLLKSKVVFDVPKDFMGAYSNVSYDDKKVRVIFLSNKDFYNRTFYLYENDEVKEIILPKKCDDFGMSGSSFYVNFRENWKEFHAGDVGIYNLETKNCELIYRQAPNASVYSSVVIKDGVLLVLDVDVKSSLHFFSKRGNAWTSEKIELPENGSMDFLVADKDANDFYVCFDSFNVPMTYFYGVKNKVEKSVRVEKSFFPHSEIEVQQHFVKSLDGTMVPYFVAHKKGLKYDGKNPTILYGYGGFEITLKAHFSNLLGKLWLNKGGVYVLSNIRGGGEYGPAWHQSALKENRDRAYQDFFAIAEDITKKNITSSKHLAAYGGSNGGLLMGVCFTQRPDLFRAINCAVPLLDMHRYHKLLAGHSWVAEYGNPDDEVDGRYIRALSPYQRIDKNRKDYPVMYLNTSTKDDRVHPGHARKFAAKLKEYGMDYFYHENINGGHAGSANLKELAFVKALDYAFFWKYLNA